MNIFLSKPVLFVALMLYSFSSGTPGWAIEESDVVASLGEQDIVLSTLLPSEKRRKARRDQLKPRSYERWILRYAASSLRTLVLDTFLKQLIEEKQLAPTEVEIDEFVEMLEQLEEQEQEESKRELEDLADKLKSLEKGSVSHRITVQKMAQLRTRQRSAQAAKTFAESNPELSSDLRRQAAQNYLSQWRVDKFIQEQFGGRVAYRYGGPQPIDAYRSLLKEKSGSGAFSIFSKILEQEFWGYFSGDARALLVPDEDAKKMYANPYWSLRGEKLQGEQRSGSSQGKNDSEAESSSQ